MSATISVELHSDRPASQQAQLARELAASLRKSPDLRVEPPPSTAKPGERGDALLGQIVLTFLTGGAATALIACLKTYLERDRSLSVSVKGADGKEIKIDGKRLSAKDADMLVKSLGEAAKPA